MTTPNLNLDELIAAQSQPHVPVNASFRALDAVCQLSVKSRGGLPVGSPSPVEGDRYLSTDGATLDQVAIYESGGWVYYTPAPGWLAFVEDESKFYYYLGAGSPTGWAELETGGGADASATYVTTGDHSTTLPNSSQIETTYFAEQFFFAGTPAPGELMHRCALAPLTGGIYNLSFAADFDFGFGSVQVNPAADFAIDVKLNDTTIGTITISSAGAFTFETTGSPGDAIAGGEADVLDFFAPTGSPTETAIKGIHVLLYVDIIKP